MTTEIPQNNPPPIAQQLAAHKTPAGRQARPHPARFGKAAKQTIRGPNKNRNMAARPGTKTARAIRLLQRPNGVSLTELMKATGWQAHSVRGFLAGALAKKRGLKIASTKRDGQRMYSIKA